MNEFEIKAIKNELKYLNIKDINPVFMDFISSNTKEKPYDLVVKYAYKNVNFLAYCLHEEFEDLDYEKKEWIKEGIDWQLKQIKEQIFSNKQDNDYWLTEFVLNQIEYELLKDKKELTGEKYDGIRLDIERTVTRSRSDKLNNLQIYKQIIEKAKAKEGVYESI